MDFGNVFVFPDQKKNSEIPNSPCIPVPITPAKSTLPRRPPIATADGPPDKFPSNNDRTKSAVASGSHKLCFPTPVIDHRNFGNHESSVPSDIQVRRQLPQPNVSVAGSPVPEWTQIPLGKGANHVYSDFTFTGFLGASQQRAQYQQPMLLNGKLPLYHPNYSPNCQTKQVSQYEASNSYLPKKNNYFSSQDGSKVVGFDEIETPINPLTPGKCKIIHDGHIVENIETEKRKSSTTEYTKFEQQSVSNANNAVHLCSNQVAAPPVTSLYGEFSLLLHKQHQNAESWFGNSGRTTTVSLAPVTPEKGNSVHDDMYAGFINLVNDGGTKKSSQQTIRNHSIEKEHVPNNFYNASGQSYLSIMESFQHQVVNQDHQYGEIQDELNHTPQQKMKKKKHRPKVIREGKSAKKPSQVTPKSKDMKNLETPSGKRKYVRKKKADVDTPTEVGTGSELDNGAKQRSARRALNFDSTVQLDDGREPFSLGTGCITHSQEHIEGRTSNCSVLNQERQPIYQNPQDIAETAESLFDLNNTMSRDQFLFDLNNTMSRDPGNHGTRDENSVQNPAPSIRKLKRSMNDIATDRKLDKLRILSSRHVAHQYTPKYSLSSNSILSSEQSAHQSTPESTLASNNFLQLLFADDAVVNECSQRNYGHCYSTIDQSHHNVISSKHYISQTSNKNNVSANEHNDHQVKYISEINKKRKADGEMKNTSSSMQYFPNDRRALGYPYEAGVSCAKNIVAMGRLHDTEQAMTYVHTEMKRFAQSNALANICTELFSSPTIPKTPPKFYDYEQVSSNVGFLGECKIMPVMPRRRNHIPDANYRASEEVKHGESHAFASGTGSYTVEKTEFKRRQQKKESQKIHTNVKRENKHIKNQEKYGTNSLDPINALIQKLEGLSIGKYHEENMTDSVHPQNALVPYRGDGKMVPFKDQILKKRLPRVKVDLDSETNRVWMLLMGKEASDEDNALGKDKEKWWAEERNVFRGRVDSFIARMHLVQGDRRFSRWKGSVVDSVVGVFLTQNVSDHLSSSAFMALAARFPSQSIEKSKESSNMSDTSTSNQIVQIVEIEDQLQDNIPSQLFGQTSSFRKPHDIEDKSLENWETSGRNSGEHSLGITNKRNIDEYEIEKEQDITSLREGTPVPLSLNLQLNPTEMDDLKSRDNVISSQNSVVSSQNSSDSPIQTAERVGMNLEPHTSQEEILNENRWNCLEFSTPFMELMQMAGTGFQELCPSKSGNVAFQKYFASTNNVLGHTGSEEAVPDLNHNVCEPVSFVKSHELSHVSMVTGVPSTSLFQSVSDSLLIGNEANNFSRKGSPISSDLMYENSNTDCIRNSSNTTQSSPIVDSCISNFLSEPLTSSEREVHFDGNLPNHKTCVPSECSKSLSNTNILQSGKQENNERVRSFQKREQCVTGAGTDSRAYKVHSESNHSACSLDDVKSSNTTEMDKELLSRTIGSITANNSAATLGATEVKGENATKPTSKKAKKEKAASFNWDSLRKGVYESGVRKERNSADRDSVDWEAVRNADVKEISNTIRERGMNNMLAERIKAFLDRLVREHGSIDLEWLRDVPPDKAKDYLLSIWGLGLKSVECVRLLTLHHLAFPVDTNVGRICVRLGWVPLQPLPESLQLHLLELYPMLETIQKYLWPRLCTLDQRTLYELHYQLITFGKVFCTKSKPNCNSCPMRGECKHFASAFASARLALPGPEEKGLVPLKVPAFSEATHQASSYSTPVSQIDANGMSQITFINNFEPIIEEPATPEPELSEYFEHEIEDDYYDDPDEIPTIKLNFEQLSQNLQDIFQGESLELHEGDMSKALVALAPEIASIPQPKLKNVSRLRTEHLVYELPDSHPLLEGLDEREADDPCPYLLAIWSPGETAQTTESPDINCTAQDMGKLCDRKTCVGCNSMREAHAQKVRGTLLVPCRTAMRGSFPLNGTYFQVNEVFADHSSSFNPIDIPRESLWNLPRRTVYFGTSVTSIFRGLTMEGIQQCFWRGFVCVRGFDQKTRAPRPLLARLHFPASKAIKNKKTPGNK